MPSKYQSRQKRKYKRGAMPIISAPLSRAIRLKTAFEEEQNNYSTNSALNAISTSGTVFDLGQIPEGTMAYGRIGTRVVLCEVEVRLNLVIADTTNFIRIICFLDRRCNGTAPTAAEILETVTYDSSRLFINKDRFKILRDKTYALSQNGNEALSDVWRFNMAEVVRFKADATGLAAENQPFLFAISDSGVVSHPTLSFGSNLVYLP